MIIMNEKQNDVISFIENEIDIKLYIDPKISEWEKDGQYTNVLWASCFYGDTAINIILYYDKFEVLLLTTSIDQDFSQNPQPITKCFPYDFNHQELKDFLLDNIHISLRQMIDKSYANEF